MRNMKRVKPQNPNLNILVYNEGAGLQSLLFSIYFSEKIARI